MEIPSLRLRLAPASAIVVAARRLRKLDAAAASAATALTMDRIQRLFQAQAQGGGAPPPDAPVVDTAEMVYVSSMALLKMLKHGAAARAALELWPAASERSARRARERSCTRASRPAARARPWSSPLRTTPPPAAPRAGRAGVPMEVMGLMLGEFVDEYTVKCIDVFAMPQTGTGVSVEAVDPVFQTKMLDMLKQTGRPEMVVGWYHSHPGFGCWLSGVDINTQQSFEALNQRAVAVVIDPIQSVKGKVVIDAFRSINPQLIMLGQEPRQTTSNIGHLNKPSIQALIHGLNRHYYSIAISYRKNELEQKMLMNLHKKSWTAGLKVDDYSEQADETEQVVEDMRKLSAAYEKAVQQEMSMDAEKLVVHNVGKIDAKKRIEDVRATRRGATRAAHARAQGRPMSRAQPHAAHAPRARCRPCALRRTCSSS